MNEYENTRRIQYEGGATFVPVCNTCGRYVRADDSIRFSEEGGLSAEPNATCKRCGRSRMFFEGWV